MISDFPDRYGLAELVLMVVHPFLLYAYWEVTPESLQESHDALGAEMDGARAVLRMYDISLIHFDEKNAHHVFDIDIGLEARHWYIPVWTAEKSYCADLGFLARTGRFHQIVRSNVVHTPRATVSHRTDEQWMRVRFVRRRKPDPGRQFEFVPPPSRNRGTSWGGSPTQSPLSQELAESMAKHLANMPTSRLGPR
jgi:hypothetical protein